LQRHERREEKMTPNTVGRSSVHVLGRIGVALSALALVVAVARRACAEPSDLPPEVGYNYDEIETPRIGATGGAQRALSNGVSALFVNPANMVASRLYHVGAFAQIWPEAKRQSYGAGAVDSIVSASHLAGGIGATYNLQDPDGVDRKWTDIRFALAFPFSDQFFLGGGGRFMWLSENGDGPLESSPASEGLPDEDIVKGFGIDIGATVKPTQSFAISVVGNNLSNPDHGFQPMSFGGGLGLVLGDFSIEGDVLADFVTWDDTELRSMLGGEALFADHVAVRAGYRYDQGAESHALSAGAGYIDNAFDLDIAVRRVVGGDPATVIMFGFNYHLESSGLTPSPGDTF
jgi:opacity protein-like surface antigen